MKPQTPAEYVALGNLIKAVWKANNELRVGRPKSSKVYKAACRLENALSSLKCALDSEVVCVIPLTADPRYLASKVFYGPELIARTPANPSDAFDAWEQPHE